jgi:Ca-activated chloride channel family protein
LLAFDHRLHLLAGPAAPPLEAASRLASLSAQGGTALHDAVYAALQLADPAAGRPVVLVLSDGNDQLSWLEAERVLEAAREGPATVHTLTAELVVTVSMRESSGPAGVTRTFALHRSEPSEPGFLGELAKLTGGSTWHTSTGTDLEKAFLGVLDDARTRYVLRYEPSDTTPGWHALDVRVRDPQLKVQARQGYTRRPALAP